MTTAADDVFRTGLDLFGAIVNQVPDHAWAAPSACAGWTNLDVLGHVGNAMAMGAQILRGEPPTWVDVERPSESVAGDPADYWADVADQCREAVVGVDLDRVVDSPRGPRSIGDGLAFPAVDLFVHAWDIGQSCGIDVELPEDVIEFAHHYLDPVPDEMKRGDGKPFGPEVAAPVDSTPTEAFLAYTGRSPR